MSNITQHLTPFTFIDRRRRWATLAVILGIIFLVRLGFWQLDRLEWRRGLNAATAAEMNASPISLNNDLSDLDLTNMINRQVSVTGAYDIDQQLIVESQSYDGIDPGRYLLTPFVLDNDPSQAILVNRGFIPVNEADFQRFNPSLETITLEGRIQRSQTLSGNRQTDVSEDLRVFRIDVAAIDEVLAYDVLPVYLLPTPDETAIQNRRLPLPVLADLSLDEGNHLSYAIQWFSFALLLLIMYVIVVYRQEVNRSKQD